jgi:hypothetical protein
VPGGNCVLRAWPQRHNRRVSGPDPIAFEAALRADGYADVSVRDIPACTQVAAHTHPFDVRALMLEGELELSCDGQTRLFRAGEVFTMAAGREHAERFGATPARYLVGRRHAG